MSKTVQSKTGAELTKDLAHHLQLNPSRVVWSNMPLGSLQGHGGRLGIVDVLTIATSYARPMLTVYEVKVSRNDFRADVNRGKFARYLDFCHQFFFACPQGVLNKELLPDGAGLIVRNENSWHVVKSSRYRPVELNTELLLALIIRGYQDFFPRMRELQKSKLEGYADLRKFANETGVKIASEISDSKRSLEKAAELFQEINTTLGGNYPNLFYAVQGLRGECKGLLNKRANAEMCLELGDITLRLLDGWHSRDEAIEKLQKLIEKKEVNANGKDKAL
ncbi:MAG TPA: MmcB family DNA repair protein [Dehalococcoidia bacterium]|nr:MmcB family DNA repair protein [Dehalococcoidia bacterium]